MSLNIITNGVTLKKTVAEATVEQPVDTEFVLPDYCPDISRMLKCRTSAKIVTKTVDKNILTMGGVICVNLMYLDAESKAVRSYNSSLTFTKECELDEDCDDCTVTARTSVDYLNCRALTGRKLALHGAVSIHYAVVKRDKTELPCEASGDGIQVKCSSAENTAEVVIGEKNIIINEDFEISGTAQSIRSVLRGEASAEVSECKAVGNKAIVKGEMNLNILYTGESEGSISKIDYAVPFSQIIDVDEISAESAVTARLEVTSLELRPKTGLDGEAKVVSVSAVISAAVTVKYNETVRFITDAYSTEYSLKLQKSRMSFRNEINSLNEAFTVNKSVDFPENIASVADLWCFVKNESCKSTEEGVMISGTVTAQIIALNSENTPVYIEKPIEYSHLFKLTDTENIMSEVSVRAVSNSYTFSSSSSLELHIEISSSAVIYKQLQAETVISAEIDAESPKKDKSGCSLVVYFAKCGEEVWNIAREYNTSVEQIMSANSLTEQRLAADIPLLLPIV